jgi:hypothetical protein
MRRPSGESRGKPGRAVGLRRRGQGLFCPVAADPHQPALGGLSAAGNISQRSRGGNAVLSGACTPRLQDAFYNGDCRTGKLQPSRIERHGHQVPPLRVNQVPGERIAGLRSLDKVPLFTRSGRLRCNLQASDIRSGGKEDCLAVGQELGPIVAVLPFLHTSQWLRSASGVRHLLERSGS